MMFVSVDAPIMDGVEKTPLKKAHEIDNITHKNLIDEMFGKNTQLSKSNILIALSRVYEKACGTTFGGKRTPAFLDHLMSEDIELIKRSDHPEGSKNAYFFKSF